MAFVWNRNGGIRFNPSIVPPGEKNTIESMSPDDLIEYISKSIMLEKKGVHSYMKGKVIH